MPDDDEEESPSGAFWEEDEGAGPGLADELGVTDLKRTYFFKDGREFAAAGKKSPIAEIELDGLVLYPPDKPLESLKASPLEEIKVRADAQGIVLNELGERRKIAGARYKGRSLYWFAETAPGTTRHLVVWFDEENKVHRLFIEDTPMTTDMIFKVRSRTHDGELGIFPEITTDDGFDPALAPS